MNKYRSLKVILKRIKSNIMLFDSRTGLLSLFIVPYMILFKKMLVDIEDALNFCFGNTLFSEFIKPMQNKEEISALMHYLKDLRPRIILEIGTAKGGTLFLWTFVAINDATIISIDLPGGPFGSGYPILRMPLYKSFARRKQKIILIRGNSHDPRTLNKVKRILSGRQIDFLFIDGDHTYEGVKKDFEMYSPLVRKGGIIAFHDIVPGPAEKVGGVPRFWKELKSIMGTDKIMEFVRDWNQGAGGIGLIIKFW